MLSVNDLGQCRIQCRTAAKNPHKAGNGFNAVDTRKIAYGKQKKERCQRQEYYLGYTVMGKGTQEHKKGKNTP